MIVDEEGSPWFTADEDERERRTLARMVEPACRSASWRIVISVVLGLVAIAYALGAGLG